MGRLTALCFGLLACAPEAAVPDAASAVDVGVFDLGLPDANVDAAPRDATTDARPDTLLEAPDLGPDGAGDLGVDASRPVERRHLALGAHPLNAPITFELPPGFDSLLIQAQGRPDQIYGIGALSGPGGPIEAAAGAAPLRPYRNPEVAVALLPQDEQTRLEAGTYRFEVQGEDPGEVEVEVWLGSGGRALRINVLLPPSTGRRPEDLPVLAFAQALTTVMQEVFGLEAEVRAAQLAEGAPAEVQLGAGLQDVAALAAAAEGDPGGLDLYLVDQIFNGENRQGGFATGLPSPVGLRGTLPSASIIRTSLLDDFPLATAQAAAHELGHALGLFHTTEAFGDAYDPITDTPPCPLLCDTDGDGVLLSSECGRNDSLAFPCRGAADNLMFWTAGGLRQLSAGQRRVLRRHPVLDP